MLIANTRKKRLLSVAKFLIELFWLPIVRFEKKENLTTIQPKKILMVRLDHIGDLIMSSAAFTGLRERFPNSEIVLLANTGAKQLFANDPRIDKLLLFNWPWSFQKENNRFSARKLKELFGVISEIRRQQFDLFIDFRGDLRFVFLFAILTNIKTRVGNSRSGKTSLLHHVSDYDLSKHEVERSFDVLECFAITRSEIRPAIMLDSKEIAIIKELLRKEADGTFLKTLAVIAPYSTQDIKSWPTQYFREVTAYLVSKDCTVVIAGTTGDAENARQIIQGLGNDAISLAGQTSLKQLGALLSIANLVIGVDTGTLHLASCFDIPIIAIFGPTRSVEFRPYSPHTIVVDSSNCSCNQFLHLQCDCPVSGFAKCMHEAVPGLVLREIDKLIHNQILPSRQ